MDLPEVKSSKPKSILRKILFTLTSLITLMAVVLGTKSWLAARAWESYKRERATQGDFLDAAHLIPPKISDSENFAMTPLFAPIFTLPIEDSRQPFKPTSPGSYWTVVRANLATNLNLDRFDKATLPPRPVGWKFGMASDFPAYVAAIQNTNQNPGLAIPTNPPEAAAIVLDDLKSSEPLLNQLRSDAARPYCRFNIVYEDAESDNSPYTAHLEVIKWTVRFLKFHAEAELVSGHSEEALKDLDVMLRIDDGLKEEPLIFSHQVRMSCVNSMLEMIGEGLAERRWSDGQLRFLQERLQTVDLIASAFKGLLGERDISENPDFNRSMERVPGDWNNSRKLDYYREFQNMLLARIDPAARVISPTVNHQIDAAWETSEPKFPYVLISPYSILTRMRIGGYMSDPRNAGYAQSRLDMAVLACALERYRLAQGQYPDDLKALVPRFVAVLPRDIINGQPLKYRRTENGRYMIYSIGWNEKDDGGVVVAHSANDPNLSPWHDNHKSQDNEQGDWVWQYPATP